MGNWGGGRWQTAFGSKLLTRKTGHVETSDTVEDKNKNVYIITGQLKLKHICAIFGGTLRITVPIPHFFFGGGACPLSPAGFTPPTKTHKVNMIFEINVAMYSWFWRLEIVKHFSPIQSLPVVTKPDLHMRTCRLSFLHVKSSLHSQPAGQPGTAHKRRDYVRRRIQPNWGNESKWKTCEAQTKTCGVHGTNQTLFGFSLRDFFQEFERSLYSTYNAVVTQLRSTSIKYSLAAGSWPQHIEV